MASKLDQSIAQVAVALGLGSHKNLATAAADVARQLSAKDIAKLPDRWSPAISANKAGEPDLKDSWDRLWFEAIAEILYQAQVNGLPHLFVLLDRNDSTYHQYIVVRLLRLVADGVEADAIVARMRTRLSDLQHVWTRESVREVVYAVSYDPRPLDQLRQFSDIVIPRTDGDTVGTYIAQMTQEFPVHQARQQAMGN